MLALLAVGFAVAAALVVALLTNIIERKHEAKNPYVRLVDVTEETTDSGPWRLNWSREYDGYRRTIDPTRTKFGGSETLPDQKSERDPWLKRLFAGYAFAIDYRERRGHAFMLHDQRETERVKQKPQPGACLNCHASNVVAYREAGLKAGARKASPVRRSKQA